jgi:hypothetical protein
VVGFRVYAQHADLIEHLTGLTQLQRLLQIVMPRQVCTHNSAVMRT